MCRNREDGAVCHLGDVSLGGSSFPQENRGLREVTVTEVAKRGAGGMFDSSGGDGPQCINMESSEGPAGAGVGVQNGESHE